MFVCQRTRIHVRFELSDSQRWFVARPVPTRLFVPLDSAALKAVIAVIVLKPFASPAVVPRYCYLRNKYLSATTPDL